MQLFSNLSELPYYSPIKITVYQGNKALISFLTKVVDSIEGETEYVHKEFNYNPSSNYLYYDFTRRRTGNIASLKKVMNTIFI